MKPAHLTPKVPPELVGGLPAVGQDEDDSVSAENPNADVPRGCRLALASVMADWGVSLADLAKATGLSKTAMHRLTENVWPARTDAPGIRKAVRERLAAAGVPEEVIATVWLSRRAYRGRGPIDEKGRMRGGAGAIDLEQEQLQHERKAREMLLAKQTLSYEARQAFALFTNPFDGEVTTLDELFQNGHLRFVREAMWQAAKGGRMVAVVGESGAGKTTLLGDLEERIQRDRSPMTVIRPSVLSMTETDKQGRMLRAADIINAIILTLDPSTTLPASAEARSRKMLRMVEESAKVGNDHLLVIEEAHALPVNTAKSLKRLHEACRVGRKPALGILLLGQPELRHKLSERRADMREVVQRCEVVDLPPLDADLRPYLEHRCKAVNRPLAELVDASGVEALRERLTVPSPDRKAAPISLLYPLAVNNLVTAALNMAAQLGAPAVTRDVVRAL